MVFSIPSFIGVGDPYDKKRVVDVRSKGVSFAVPGPKQGHLPDALFTKEYQSIHEGDKFVEPGTAEKRIRAEKAKKRITPNGFRHASPPQKACGLGGYFGCIDPTPLPHETEYVVPRKGEAPPRPPGEKRGVFTAPTKHGTYGFPGLTLSAVGQDYIADFYEGMRIKERAEHEKHRLLMKGNGFRAACRRGGTFDESLATGASQCYRMTKPMAPRRPPPARSVPAKQEHAWRPAGHAELQPIIEYREDPYDGYDPRVGPKKKVKKDDEKNSWRPGGATNSSWYTKSIAFARL